MPDAGGNLGSIIVLQQTSYICHMGTPSNTSGNEQSSTADAASGMQPQSLTERFAAREPRLDRVQFSAKPPHATAFMRLLWMAFFLIFPIAASGMVGAYLDLEALNIIAYALTGIAIAVLITAAIVIAIPQRTAAGKA